MGPLAGIRVIEIEAHGPGPWCAMALSDMGADVIRVDRATEVEPSIGGALPRDFGTRRGRPSIAVDLRDPDGAELVLQLVEQADALIEGYRPGVAERLGIGPDVCLERNPRLVYGRATGWGQDGPLSQVPGHDINYLALTGLLHAMGPSERPVPPLNLVGDYGGGGMLLAFGVLCGVIEAGRSGRGQVVDAAMLDGSALLASNIYAWTQTGFWTDTRESNLLDGGAPFYGVYETSDDRWVAVGAIEPKFYAVLVAALGLSLHALPPQYDRDSWPEVRARFAQIFRLRSRAQWVALFESLDTCFSPVLTVDEAMHHEQQTARQAFVEVDGVARRRRRRASRGPPDAWQATVPSRVSTPSRSCASGDSPTRRS